ncbi:MAG: TetR/AcrR family transcriptional regulator [Reichenbachiella sp.]|uniref:TetR/AcrR family transcriptional regulator n=1 Tax=Reichenbachiella sp. TaxID=2184521 RepID=UPI0032633B85
MAEVKVSQEELMIGFLNVFRKMGYDGASMNELAQASGLKKSSLYHRFPGGKQQMAKEVLDFIGSLIRQNVTQVLMQDTDRSKRLKTALKNIDELYASGKNACVLRTLSMESGLGLFSNVIITIFDDIIRGFAKLARDYDYSKKESQKIAEGVLIKIQGSLILANAQKNTNVFKNALKEIQSTFE